MWWWGTRVGLRSVAFNVQVVWDMKLFDVVMLLDGPLFNVCSVCVSVCACVRACVRACVCELLAVYFTSSHTFLWPRITHSLIRLILTTLTGQLVMFECICLSG